MRPITHYNKAVSVVIGTLLLTLVVVSAATTFALFIADQQEARQKTERAQFLQEQENLRIISIIPVDSTNDGTWDKCTFTIMSNHASDTVIFTFRVNNLPLEDFNITYQNGTTIQKNYSDTIKLETYEQIDLMVTIPDDFFPSFTSFISTAQPVKLDIYTRYGNNFIRSFRPPNPWIKIDTESLWDASNLTFNQYTIFDGSQSEPDEQSSILNYEWFIQETEEYAEPYIFKDLDNDWQYDNGEFLDGDPDRTGSTPTAADVEANQKGGYFAIDDFGEEYTYIDLDGDWTYTHSEPIVSYDADGDGDLARPGVGDIGGLFVADPLNIDQYYFQDTNSNWVWDTGESWEPYEAAPTPNEADEGGLWAFDFNENVELTGKKVREKNLLEGIKHYVTLTVTDTYGMKGIDSIVFTH